MNTHEWIKCGVPPSPRLRVKKAIALKVWRQDQRWIAASYWLNVHGCGGSKTAAMADCMRSLAADYDFYRDNEKVLGRDLLAKWQRVQRFIEPRQ